MSSSKVIEFKNVSKSYTLYKKPSDVINDFIGRKSKLNTFQALRDISFEVHKGDIVGLIGRNGAGKSTLLKILAGVLPQTTGEFSVIGKVSAILELGTGFHPEYSGRDNVVMGGMCLGLSKKEILDRMEDIIEFSELAEHIDRPFKTYSSGMKARLTFATAISIVPEVLIIDEALSVGDMLFAEKCFDKIKEFAKNGTTIFFVSHSLAHIYELCNKAILLNKGEVLTVGSPSDVGLAYEKLLQLEQGGHIDHGESKLIAIKELQLENCKDMSIEKKLINGDEYKLKVIVEAKEDIADINIGFRLKKVSGQVIYGASVEYFQGLLKFSKGEKKIVEFIFTSRLNNSDILLDVAIVQGGGKSGRLLQLLSDPNPIHAKSELSFQGEFDLCSKVTVVDITAL